MPLVSAAIAAGAGGTAGLTYWAVFRGVRTVRRTRVVRVGSRTPAPREAGQLPTFRG